MASLDTPSGVTCVVDGPPGIGVPRDRGVAGSDHIPSGATVWAPYGLGQPTPQGTSAFASL
eukprot:14176055-Alexandrium_andersonii.AAC.1